MYIPPSSVISPAILLRGLFFSRNHYQCKNIFYFSHARFALRKLICVLIDKGIKDLWVPSFVCREAIVPLETTTIRLRFYNIQDDLSPDYENIDIRHKHRSAFMIVHYFGFPNDMAELINFCKEHNLFLIEDCAQVHNTEYGGKLLGSFGSAAIFSPRKYLPIPDGAFLLINSEIIQKESFLKSTNKQKEIRPIIISLTKWFLMKSRFPVAFWYKNQSVILRHEELPYNDTMDEVINYYSEKMLRVLEKDLLLITKKRQDNFLFLLEKLNGLPIRPLFPKISNAICPYVFPFSINLRDEILTKLRKYGIGAQYWPALPKEVFRNSSFPLANKLRDNLLLLPIHQDLSQKHIEYIADTLASIIK